MAQHGAHLQGLVELQSALRRVDKAAAAELGKELKEGVASKFATDARNKAVSQGLLFSGRLMGSIKPSVRGGDAYVRSSPPLKPGPKSRAGYAAVYEFGHGGRRAFLEPTRQEWIATGKLEHELGGYLDWITKEFRA